MISEKLAGFASRFPWQLLHSKDSSLSWIIYTLTVLENHKTPREFNVPNYIDGYETFVKYYEYHNQAAYVILQEGKEIKKENWSE